MFKKPKKKPAALRSTKNDETTTNITSSSSKKRRRHSDDESSSSSDDEKNATQDLLQQLRDERSNNINSSSKKINTSSTLTKKNPSMMHQYKSNNDMLTAQQMATRTAEHHPAEKSTDTSNNNNNNINAHLPSLQSNQPRSKFLAGPLKAPTFVRTTARFDYQPDICKDYKETGFCGYGDTCIYLHDRGDTKSGWEMEREYEEKKRGEEEKKRGEVEKFMRSMMNNDGTTNEDEEEDGLFGKEETIEEDGIPFACHICRGPFRNPIVTSCQHYFCETCMSTRVKEIGTGCPICSKDTHGVLNFPQKLVGKKRRLIGRDGSWEEFFKKNKKQR